MSTHRENHVYETETWSMKHTIAFAVLIEQLRQACSVALGDLLAQGMPPDVSTGRLLQAAIDAAEKYLVQMEAKETEEHSVTGSEQTTLSHFLTVLEDREVHAAVARHADVVTPLADALRVVSFRCDGNEDSEAAFDRVWRTLADKTRGPAKCAK